MTIPEKPRLIAKDGVPYTGDYDQDDLCHHGSDRDQLDTTLD